MKAIILAGGFGTRLRPLSCTRPKLLFPVGNKPLLDRTLEWLASARSSSEAVDGVVLAVNYMAEAFVQRYGNSSYGMKLHYSREDRPLGTGGPIKKAEEFIGHDEPFLVLNGDILTDIDYAELVDIHRVNDAIATIALYRVEDPSRYGVAELAENGRVVRFVEKPVLGRAPSNFVNAGIYVLDPKIFTYIPPSQPVSIEHEIFPKLVDEGKLYGHSFEGVWLDIGEPKDYLMANRFLLDMRVKKSLRGSDLSMDGEVVIEDPIAVDNKVTIGEKSKIGPHVSLGERVSVGRGVRIENSIVFPRATISDFTSIVGAIIGESAIIGKWVKIEDECIIGDHTMIHNNVTLTRGVTVCPSKEVSESVLSPGRVM